MNIAKTVIAVIVGFVLGAYFYHPSTARAASGSGTIRVIKVPEGAYTDAMIANRDVVGFSCVNGPMGGECYLAVR